ncbi:MAG: leucine-rich repeat domain-containing protein, partial [Bacteroidales bacterium]|nr:leucine-rich repeat domain-containing protein [Bacteroidales bacterium]
EIPEGWTELEGFAFKDCKELKSITLPTSLKAIGTRAFEGCENLREISIPSSVESIGYCAFKDCPCSKGMDESYWKERPASEEDDIWINEILG